jgi:hypothetical protein
VAFGFDHFLKWHTDSHCNGWERGAAWKRSVFMLSSPLEAIFAALMRRIRHVISARRYHRRRETGLVS